MERVVVGAQLHSSVGYAFLMNLPSLGSVDFGANVTKWQLDTVLQADFWVIFHAPMLDPLLPYVYGARQRACAAI
eukprot:COSAG05_NODE_649_length_8102_cov_157.470823_12_plen_75_part_00